MGVHDEHRERLRRQFLKRGDCFEPHQLLELLLTYAIPRKDTNPAAHELVKHFGGFREVLDAPFEDLIKVDGVGEKSALLIKLVQQMAINYAEPDDSAMIVNSSEDSGKILWPRFLGRRDESAFLMCLDAKNKVLCIAEVGRGDVSHTPLDVRRVVEVATSRNATAVVLAHNHPSGMAVPSEDDVAVTREVKRLLSLLGIVLFDHLVVTEDDFVSMADSGLI